MKVYQVVYWHVINIILIASGLLLPWVYPHSSFPIGQQVTLPGWRVIFNFSAGVFISNFSFTWLDIPILLVGFGGIAILTYIVIITAMVIQKRFERSKVTKFMLIVGFFILLYIPLVYLTRANWPPLWGYWLTLFGLLSCASFELKIK